MRRALPFLLLAFALGCGGSGAPPAPRAFLRIQGGDAEELGTGQDAQGNVALVGVGSDGTVRVVTEAGTARFAIPPAVPSAPPRVAGDFVLAPSPSGTAILDRRTGTHRFSAGEFPGVSDGSRVVWVREDGFVLEDLATGARTPIADAASVDALRGDRMVVSKVIGTKTLEGSPIPVPDYGYFLQPLGGGARIALTAPEGYDDESAAVLGADGSVAGNAYAVGDLIGNDLPSSIVRWSPEGTPSVPAPRLRGFPLALRDDGSLLIQERATERVLLLRDGTARSLDLRATLPSASPDGTVVFVQSEGSTSISAYRSPDQSHVARSVVAALVELCPPRGAEEGLDGRLRLHT